MKFDLAHFSIADTLACSTRLRLAIDGQGTVEGIARQVCAFFHESLLDERDNPATALVRLYATHPYARLPLAEQRFARKLLNEPAVRWPDLKCLTLMGTSGELPEWNDRAASQGHRAIPLPSTSIIEQAPMIAQLFRQMGVELSAVLRPDPSFVSDLARKTYNVFHVPKAAGSPYIPAQREFVQRHGIESVVGFGGALPWGEHFAVVLFSRVPIDAAVASRFKTFALDVKSRLIKLGLDDVFDAGDATPATSVALPQSAATTTSLATVEANVTSTSAVSRGFRQFRDSQGLEWNVWAIVPSAETVLRARSNRWQAGWLLFESTHESRRLSPIPDDWHSLVDGQLEELCARAERKRSIVR